MKKLSSMLGFEPWNLEIWILTTPPSSHYYIIYNLISNQNIGSMKYFVQPSPAKLMLPHQRTKGVRKTAALSTLQLNLTAVTNLTYVIMGK